MKTNVLGLLATFICATFLQPLSGFAGGERPYAECPTVNLGADTVLCSTAMLTLDVENSGATYLWNDGSTGAQLTVFYGGEYWVEVTRDGCTVSDTINVNYASLLYADFYYEQTGGECLPAAVEFWEYSESCMGGVVEWSWDFGDGSYSSDPNPVHFFTEPGNHTVTLRVENGAGNIFVASQEVWVEGIIAPVVELGEDITVCESTGQTLSAGNPGATYLWNTGETIESIIVPASGIYSVVVSRDGCSSEDSIHVALAPDLSANFSWMAGNGCLPAVQFTDESLFCSDVLTGWSWDFGDGSFSGEQHPEHLFAAEGNYAVRLTITHSSGDTATVTRFVQVDRDTVAADLGENVMLCPGNSVTLDPGVPGATYLWNTGAVSEQLVVAAGGRYKVEVNRNGCITEDSVTVQVVPSAVVAWGFGKDGDCLPVKVQFRDSSVINCGQTVTAWAWDFGDGNTSALQEPEHVYTYTGSFIARLTLTLSGGGTASLTRRVDIENTPPGGNLPPVLSVCRGETIALDAGEGASYRWYPALGLSDTTIRNPLLTATVSNWYTVKISGCSVAVTDSVYVIADAPARPLISQHGNNLDISGAGTVQWYKDGSLITGATDKLFRPSGYGSYVVRLFNEKGCYSESEPFFFVPANDAEPLAGGIRVSCSPNPARDKINVLLSEVPPTPARLTVFSAQGRAVLSTILHYRVNSIYLPPGSGGMYFLEIVVGNTRKVIPVAVQ